MKKKGRQNEGTKQYPHIVTLEYIGACGKTFETSMTWAEAIILNRKANRKNQKYHRERAGRGMLHMRQRGKIT